MKYAVNIKSLVLTSLATLCLAGCMDYEAINTPEYLPRELSTGAYFDQMQINVVSVQTNAYQMHENLIGDVYGRYMASTNNSHWYNTYATFNALVWLNQSPFVDILARFYPAWIEVKNKTGGEGVNFAWAQLLRVAAMQRLTDMYGPIPYSQVTGSSISAPYDSQEEVYSHLFEDIDFAISELTAYSLAFPGEKPMEDYDKVYGGDFTKWVKFANSLKLRMAVRVVYANPALAQQKAEEAVSHVLGIIASNDDNADIEYASNPIKIMWDEFADARACADIVSYMNGYNDPRRPKYFQQYNGEYVGLRSGINLSGTLGSKDIHSAPAIYETEPVMWLNAAEVAFLRAEGALRGWAMGGTVEDLYNEGIRLSFAQHGIAGYETYIADASSLPGNHTGDAPATAVSTITIKWDEGTTSEIKLERLITQKWIALWPLGQEAWSDYRRTGYPKFFPVTENRSTENVLTTVAFRIPYPPDERINNAANYENAVSLLGGADAYGTKLWWDKK